MRVLAPFLVVGLFAFACTGSDPDAVTPVPDAGADATAPPPPAPVDAGADAATPGFCDKAGARVCTDFEDVPQGSATDWRTVLAVPEVVGIGLAPVVRTDPSEPERGAFFVTKLVATGPDASYGASRRSHTTATPGWTNGVPARSYEVKFRIAKADPLVRAGIFGVDGGSDGAPGVGVVLDCASDAGGCTVFATRGNYALEISGVSLNRGVWTLLTVDVPPSGTLDGGTVSARTVTFTFEEKGGSPQTHTVQFPDDTPAPSVVRADVGLGVSNPQKADWEIWYDDVAFRY